MPWINGIWYPYRRNPAGIRCTDCNLTFRAGSVPPLDRKGERICADCARKRGQTINPQIEMFQN